MSDHQQIHGLRSRRYLERVSEAESMATENVGNLDEQDRAWLDERLVEYQQLLNYLREH